SLGGRPPDPAELRHLSHISAGALPADLALAEGGRRDRARGPELDPVLRGVRPDRQERYGPSPAPLVVAPRRSVTPRAGAQCAEETAMNRQKVLSEGIRAILGGNLVAALVKLGILFRD